MRPALTRRRTPPSPTRAAALEHGRRDEVPDEDPQDAADARVGGWSTGARANTSILLRWAAWGLLVLGPILGAAALLATPPTPAPVGQARAAVAPSGAGSQGAAGFATRFVDAFLRAGEGDEDTLAAYYPPASTLHLDGTPDQRHGEQLTVARLRQSAPAVWSVTISARVSPTPPAGTRTPARGDSTAEAAAQVRYFQVPIAVRTVHGTSGYVALAMPAEVAAPPRITPPALDYGPLQPATESDARTRTVTDFLGAYLTGQGETDRYLAPGTTIRPIRPAPYTTVALDQITADAQHAGATPAEGARSRLLATVRAADPDGIHTPLSYALTLTVRAGRWEISSLDPAPTTAASSGRPTSSPAATAGP